MPTTTTYNRYPAVETPAGLLADPSPDINKLSKFDIYGTDPVSGWYLHPSLPGEAVWFELTKSSGGVINELVMWTVTTVTTP